MKICKACFTERAVTKFSKDSSRKDGLQVYCKLCKSAKMSACYHKNVDVNREKHRVYAKTHAEEARNRTAKWQRANRGLANSKSLRWQSANRDKMNAIAAKYRASKVFATPCWLTDAQLLEIKKFYSEAKLLSAATGIVHEVDHIVPLQGENVTGLHVPWNLQILTKSENSSKRNKVMTNA